MARQFVSIWWFAAVFFLTPSAAAQFVSGSDGSDGAFNPTADVEVDLSLASSAPWDTASPVAGQGVYDSGQWAVVFKYSTIDIPAGVTVTFKNHPSGAPVVWLATGNVTISGSVNLNGQRGHTSVEPFSHAEPGPGGFAGGVGGIGQFHTSGGFGPGGGPPNNTTFGPGGSGSYATIGTGGINVSGGSTYGNIFITPLIGGSGGAGGYPAGGGLGGGGAGGGAILVASSTETSSIRQVPKV